MEQKRRIEDVLGVHIHDEQLAYIMQYYRQFYSEPESFAGDGLVDLIMEDLKIKKPTNLKDILNQVEGMDIKHLDPYNSLALGKYKDTPVYAMFATGSEVEKVAGYPNVESRPSDQSKEELFAIGFLANDKKSAIILVMSGEAIDAVNTPEQNAILGYTGIFTMPLIDYDVKDLHTYYVPFVASGQGRNPVMWINHNADDSHIASIIFEELSNKWQDWGTVIYADNIKDAYNELKLNYPGVDLDTALDVDRYLSGRHFGRNIIYNRNHLAYNGNIASAMAMLPWSISNILKKEADDGSNVADNVYNCINGAEEWDSFKYYILGTNAANKTVITEENAKPSNSQTASDGRERGDGSARSPIGKMFNNASSDYKQVDINK